jgi:hypothetical protein
MRSMANPYVKTVVTCAGPNCGKTKGESNHWFRIRQGLPSLEIRTYPEGLLASLINDTWQPLCGEACLQKAVSEAVGKMHGEAGK